MDKFIEESGFNFEDIEDGEVIPETDSLREYMPPKGFVNFNKKREEEIRKELDDAEKRALHKPINTYDDWINRNKQGESGSQLDVLYAEQESILQKINDLESQSIRVGLVGSDDELIEIDDDIEFQKEKLQDVIKQIDSFAGETDWLQFTKDFVNLDNAGLDIHDLLELQKDKDIELAETKEEDDLDEYGRNVNQDESSIWDLFKDNVPKSKEHLTDEDVKDILEEIRAGGIIFNELSPEVQEELIQYSDDNKLYMGGKIAPSIFDDESYSKERITDEDGGISVEELGKKLADAGTEMVDHEGDIDRYSRQYGFDSEDLYKAFRDAGGEFEFEKELDESYSKEKNLYSRVEPLNDIEKEIYLKQDGEDRYFWEKDLGSADPFNPYKKPNAEGIIDTLGKWGGIIGTPLTDEDRKRMVEWDADDPDDMFDDAYNWVKGKLSKELKSTEGGYGSGKNRHGFGHSKWMREAEVNDSVIKSEDMNKDAVPLEEYTYHSRKESNRHKRNPMERRLEDQIRKREQQLRDMGIDPEDEL